MIDSDFQKLSRIIKNVIFQLLPDLGRKGLKGSRHPPVFKGVFREFLWMDPPPPKQTDFAEV